MISEKSIANQNKKYLDNHKVTKYIEEMMAGLMKEKPDEPLLFMMKFIYKKAQQSGINVSQFKLETSSRLQDGSSDNFTRSYEKPWLSGVNKKMEYNNSPQQEIVKEETTMNAILVISSGNEEDSLNKEFCLVSSPDCTKPDVIPNNIEEYRKMKNTKESGTKENLLKILNEEENSKLAEKLQLQEKINEKDVICEHYDCAPHLEEDADICLNEYSVSPPSTQKVQAPVIVKKHVIIGNTNPDNGFHLTMCPNCAKFYHAGEYNGSGVQYSSPYAGNSCILDDLESASQVNGPRPISDLNNRLNRPLSAKKKLSITDIEVTAKAWPVLDANSDLSLSKKGIPRSRPSSRHFQS